MQGEGITMSNIVTAKELSQYLKLSDSTIYNLASNGVLPGFKIGDSWRFDLDEIIAFIKKMKRGNGGRERDINGKDGKRKWKS
jgi:excisionase family DNA binding protein